MLYSPEWAVTVTEIEPHEVLNPCLLPGNANRDSRFDQRDVIQLLQSGKYVSGEDAVWSDGDFVGEGMFDSADLTDYAATTKTLRIGSAATIWPHDSSGMGDRM
jgi:hypothetical protein